MDIKKVLGIASLTIAIGLAYTSSETPYFIGALILSALLVVFAGIFLLSKDE